MTKISFLLPVLVSGLVLMACQASTPVTDDALTDVQAPPSVPAQETQLSITGMEPEFGTEPTMDEGAQLQMLAADQDPDLEVSLADLVAELDPTLVDVAGTAGSGMVGGRYNSETNQFELLAEMTNLPDPTGTDFYEGWIVRRGAEMSVLSTGRAVKRGASYINAFQADTDFTDHDFYVLTLEPDDGDPAPAAHILEGEWVVVE